MNREVYVFFDSVGEKFYCPQATGDWDKKSLICWTPDLTRAKMYYSKKRILLYRKKVLDNLNGAGVRPRKADDLKVLKVEITAEIKGEVKE